MATLTTSSRQPLLVRSRRDRVFRGVAGGLGARIGVDPVLLRIILVVLTLAGGAGVLLYGAGVVASVEPEPGEEPEARPFDLQQAGAVALMALGLMLFLRAVGVWFGDALVWPALLAGIASAVVWTRGGPASVDLTDPLGVRGAGPRALGRVVVGVTLLIASIVVLVGTASNPFDVLAPAVGVLVGLVMLAAPLLQRVWVQVGDAREERARAQARDEVAAHLHDSVLQTLALIQRAGQDPAQVTALARRQERELRAWLYGGRASTDAPASLVAAVEQVAAEVEEDFPLAIEVVVVGDAPLADETRALLAAVREALTNVGKHAGVDRASCFVEVADGEVVAFVRDRGIGFDPASVPPDRRGIADSLRGRLERIGGHVTIESTEEDGTEVELAVPLPRAARSTG